MGRVSGAAQQQEFLRNGGLVLSNLTFPNITKGAGSSRNALAKPNCYVPAGQDCKIQFTVPNRSNILQCAVTKQGAEVWDDSTSDWDTNMVNTQDDFICGNYNAAFNDHRFVIYGPTTRNSSTENLDPTDSVCYFERVSGVWEYYINDTTKKGPAVTIEPLVYDGAVEFWVGPFTGSSSVTDISITNAVGTNTWTTWGVFA